MSGLFTCLNPGKLYYLRKPLNLLYSGCKCSIRRTYSDVPKQFVSFDEIVAQRRAQARRSIVVQVSSEASFKELYGYCSKYASINGIQHYKSSVGENFMLIEFSSEENVKHVLQNCGTHLKDPEVMALQSPFLWFRASTGKKEKLTLPEGIDLVSKNTEMVVNEDSLFGSLVLCQNVSEQIETLYKRTALNDLGIRLRYMVARQIECLLDSLYANIAVLPFGSSVNGYGKLGCDLDLVLTNNLTDDMCSPEKRLVYQATRSEGGQGAGAARHLELAAAALELRGAGAARLQRILHARVPIVKCRHLLADMDCDLCYNNLSGVHMSRLVWSLGALDPRARPLVFAVRRWADTVGLTNPHPGRWITNFPLTLMVLFFLQQKTKDGPILPTVNMLYKRAGKEDSQITDDSTFLCDLNKLPSDLKGHNSADLGTLLLQFFEFYAQFDFKECAISINEGESIRKPAAQPLYIVNPLDVSLNVSRNVSFEECERLKTEVRNAAWQLESIDTSKEDWGLLSLIEKKSARNIKKLLKVGNSHRLVSVKDLFDDEDSKSNNRNVKRESVILKKEPFKFKNSQVASEVYRIRRNKIV